MSTNLGFLGRLLATTAGKVLSFGDTVTAPVVLPTPDAPVITNEDDAAQTIAFSVPGGLSYNQVRYEVAGAGPYTPTGFTIQLSPSVSYLPGAIVLYIVGIEGVRNESQRVANLTTLVAAATPSPTQPAAPTLTPDDTQNTLTISSAYALSQLEYRTADNLTVRALPALLLSVGGVARVAGYYEVRVKADAATNRLASAWAASTAFAATPVTSAPAGYVAGPRMVNDEEFGASGPLRYQGSSWVDDSGSRYLGGRERYCLDSGDSVELDFYNTQVHLVTVTGPNTDKFDVYLKTGLNGAFVLHGEGSQYSPAHLLYQDVYHITGLALGAYTIKVVARNPFNFDGFRVGA